MPSPDRFAQWSLGNSGKYDSGHNPIFSPTGLWPAKLCDPRWVCFGAKVVVSGARGGLIAKTAFLPARGKITIYNGTSTLTPKGAQRLWEVPGATIDRAQGLLSSQKNLIHT
jgi:hypothetical protein